MKTFRMLSRRYLATQLCVAVTILILLACLRPVTTLSDSSVCDQGWTYHAASESCLQIQEKELCLRYRCLPFNTCNGSKGGPFSNESGSVVLIKDVAMDTFVNEFLRELNITKVLVKMDHEKFSWILEQDPHWYRYIWSGRKDILSFVTAGKRLTLQFPDGSNIQPVLCRVAAKQDTSNSTCEVNVESTSETTVRMSWRPGQIGHLIKLYTEVRECADVEFSNCKLFRKFHAKEVSNFTDTNFTVDGLQPNTRYKIAIEVFNVENKKLVFNNTFAIKTREETRKTLEVNVAVIGLSIALVISFCIIVVLSILYYRLVKQRPGKSVDVLSKTSLANNRGTSSSRRFETSVGTKDRSDTRTQAAKPGGTKVRHEARAANTAGTYGNIKKNVYDQTEAVDADEHIYET